MKTKKHNREAAQWWIDFSRENFRSMAECTLEKYPDLDGTLDGMTSKQLRAVVAIASMAASASSEKTRRFFSKKVS